MTCVTVAVRRYTRNRGGGTAPPIPPRSTAHEQENRDGPLRPVRHARFALLREGPVVPAHPPDRLRRTARATPTTAGEIEPAMDAGSSRCCRPPTDRSSRTPSTSSTISSPPSAGTLRLPAWCCGPSPTCSNCSGARDSCGPAMHHRWDFDEVNVPFLAKDFSAALAVGADDATREAVFAFASERMRSATAAFGVTPEVVRRSKRPTRSSWTCSTPTWPARPTCWVASPPSPTTGSWGPPRAPGPRPVSLPPDEATRPAGLWRWVERMNAPVLDASEYGDCSQELFATASPTRWWRCSATSARSTSERPSPRWPPSTPGWRTTPKRPRVTWYWASRSARISGTTTFDWRGRPMTVVRRPLPGLPGEAGPGRLRSRQRRRAGDHAQPLRRGWARPAADIRPPAGYCGRTTARSVARPRSPCSPGPARRRGTVPGVAPTRRPGRSRSRQAR